MKTIRNPILRGFCPDPCMIRTGDDYYIATSTFEWWPCVNLYHSKDLAHWEQLPSPLREPGQMDLRAGLHPRCIEKSAKKRICPLVRF